MEFKEWLLKEDAGSPGAKQSLYPMGYGGIGLYPPSDVITWGADAITYMPKELRQLTFVWGDGMLSNPFDKDSLYEKIKGKQAKQMQSGNLKTNGEGKVPNFSNEIKQQTIQVGTLKVGGTGFEKSSDYVMQSPNKKGFWDLKQIGERKGKFILPNNLED